MNSVPFSSSCVRCRLLSGYCVCSETPSLEHTLKGMLLVHQREFKKHHSTSNLTRRLCPSFKIELWRRSQPILGIDQASKQQAVLVYPADESFQGDTLAISEVDASRYFFVLLDGTWQQTSKMVRQTPALAHLPRLSLNDARSSIYNLRRNQREVGMSTVEAFASIYDQLGFSDDADNIRGFLSLFLRRFEAQRSGHYRSSAQGRQ